MPTFSINLTDTQVADVEATINANLPIGATPTTCAAWLDTNVRQLVAQCSGAACAKKCAAAGISADLTKFGVTPAEQDALIAARKTSIATAAAAPALPKP